MKMKNSNKLATVILAAGQGKRMNNPDSPKVLAELNGKPLIKYVLELTQKINAEKNVVIVGHKKELIIDFVNSLKDNKIEFAEQNEQLGTGHAVDQSREILQNFVGNILILCGDVPLIKSNTIMNFIEQYENSESDISVLSMIANNPKGYGRIIRDDENNFLAITEEKDANETKKLIREVNSGIIIAKADLLYNALSKLQNNNAQGEYYLTDVIDIIRSMGKKVTAFSTTNFDELQGINTFEDLERAKSFLDSNA